MSRCVRPWIKFTPEYPFKNEETCTELKEKERRERCEDRERGACSYPNMRPKHDNRDYKDQLRNVQHHTRIILATETYMKQ